jgi:HAD superfamily hydrolase (TIGR01509 family)
MRFKAVLFDCDGTLIDSEYAHYLSWKEALARLGGDLTEEEYVAYAGKSAKTNAELLSQKVEEANPDQILDSKRSSYQKFSEMGLPPIEPTIAFLKELGQKKEEMGLKIGVCSAAKKEEILNHLQHLKITHLIDLVLSGESDLDHYIDPEGVNKPKPYIYLEALKQLGISSDECIVIEDSASGVTAGICAGCLTVAIPNQHTKNQDLSHAHLCLESLSNFDIDSFFKLFE